MIEDVYEFASKFEEWLQEEKNVSFEEAARIGRYLTEFVEETNA